MEHNRRSDAEAETEIEIEILPVWCWWLGFGVGRQHSCCCSLRFSLVGDRSIGDCERMMKRACDYNSNVNFCETVQLIQKVQCFNALSGSTRCVVFFLGFTFTFQTNTTGFSLLIGPNCDE